MKCGICKQDIASVEEVCLGNHPGEWVHEQCCPAVQATQMEVDD